MRIRRTLPLLLFPIVFLTSPPVLGAPAWKALGPFGGSVYRLTLSPSDPRVAYAVMEPEGAFRTTDGGTSWTPIHGAYVSSNVAIHPSRPGTIYLASAYSLLKSTDFGSHWIRVTGGLEEEPGVTAIAVDPARPTRLYAGGLLGFYRSTDGGESWQRTPEGLPPTFNPGFAVILPLPRPAGTVLAVYDSQLFKSTDAGETWKALAVPYGVVTIAAAPSEPSTLYASYANTSLRQGGIFRSRDSGASWTPLASSPKSRVTALAVALRSARTVWAGTAENGLWVSYDAGAHWKSPGPGGASFISSLALTPSAPHTVLVGTRVHGLETGGIFASANGGATWTRRNQGLAGLNMDSLGFDPDEPDGLWAVRYQSLYRSTNGGRTWTRPPLQPDSQGLLRAPTVAPSDPSVLYATTPRGLWRTVDGGRTWSNVLDAKSLDMPWRSLWIDPVSPVTLWSQSGSGLNQSLTGGATWVYRTLEPPGEVTHLAFSPSLPTTIYAAGSRTEAGGRRGTVWRSTDGGVTWSSAEQGLDTRETSAQALAVDPIDPRLLYLSACGYYCSGGRLWQSTNGGSSWTATGNSPGSFGISLLATSPVAGTVWAAVDGGRIFRSVNGGATWQELDDGLYARYTAQLTLDSHDPRRVYAATSSGVWVLEDKP